MASTSSSLTATGSVSLTKAPTDTLLIASIRGDYTTTTFVFEGTVDGTNYYPMAAIGASDGVAANGTISPTNATTRTWYVPCQGATIVRLRVTAIASNTIYVTLNSGSFVGLMPFQVGLSAGTTGAQNISATSATAFTVGQNGTTTPGFTVDTNTASSVTGVKITSNAAGSGVAIVVTSSGTDENLTINAKGTGTVTINGTATGNIVLGAAATGVSFSGTGALTAYSGTAIPANGTAGSGIKLSSVANFGIFFGSGVPTLAAAQGSLYIRNNGTTTNDRLYVNNNGSTGWTAVTTAA